MTLNELVLEAVNLQEQGYGDMKVFAVHSASGATDEVHTVDVSDFVGEAGPFDLEEGEEYVSIITGD